MQRRFSVRVADVRVNAGPDQPPDLRVLAGGRERRGAVQPFPALSIAGGRGSAQD